MAAVTGVLDRARVEGQSDQKQEPAWMKELRLRAWQAYEHFGDWPRLWKTDLGRLRLKELAPYQAVKPAATEADLPEALAKVVRAKADAGALLLHDNAGVIFRRRDPSLERQGVILCSLDEALREHGELVQAHFAREAVPVDLNRFAALNAALWSGGVFLYVPADVELELPIQVQYWMSGAGTGMFERVLIITERNAKVTFVDGYESEQGLRDPSYHFGAVEIYAGEGSRITFASLQNFGGNVWNFTTRRAILERDARVDWVLGDLGSRLSRTGFHSLLRGTGSESNSICVFFASKGQHLDIDAAMQHLGDYSVSDMIARGVAKDDGKSVYTGMTDIDKGARETRADQRENTLILNAGAEADAIPGLLIEEHDLQAAGHAATVGWIDPEQLFYLRSRGLPENLAVRMIVQGFFTPLMERIPLPAVREHLEQLVEEKLG